MSFIPSQIDLNTINTVCVKYYEYSVLKVKPEISLQIVD